MQNRVDRTPERNRKIVALWNSGVSFKEIADSLGLNRETVRSIIKGAAKRGEAVVSGAGRVSEQTAAAHAPVEGGLDAHAAVGCLWMVDEGDDWRYCQRATVPESPWCKAHAKTMRAYWRRLQEAQASDIDREERLKRMRESGW